MADKAYHRFFENIEQLDLFARGLYYLAGVDGVADEEVAVIREFLGEMGEPDLMSSLDKVPFDPRMAAFALPTHHQRALFLKTAVVLVRADGTITDLERKALDEVAEAMGMTEELPGIEEQMAGVSI